MPEETRSSAAGLAAVAAIRAAQRGAQVTVIEQAELGGTCLNWGCIPTKTLIASAVALERVRGAAAYGIEVPGDVKVNLAKIRERKDRVVSTQVKGIHSLFKSWGVNLCGARLPAVTGRGEGRSEGREHPRTGD